MVQSPPAAGEAMTRDKAIDLVFDLISAVREYDITKNRVNRDEYEKVREKVIEALTDIERATAEDAR